MSNLKIEQVTESVMNLMGKNLFFCNETNSLYWTDVIGGTIFRMDMTTTHNKLHACRIMGETSVSFCIPIQGKRDQYIVGCGRRLLLVQWDGLTTMAQIVRVLVEIPVTGVRMNECNVDSKGRLYFGTMTSEEHGETVDTSKRIGSLYCYTMQDGLIQLRENVGLSNGITWNNQNTKLYYVDSLDLNIKVFDYDVKTGSITNEKVCCDLTVHGQARKVFPTSMTMDSQDNIWLCMFGSGKILKMNTRTHKVDQEVKLSAQQVTGCAFGGKNLDQLFVTTSAQNIVGPQTYPAGYLFRVGNTGSKGTEMQSFIMN